MDRKLERQQKLTNLPFGIVVIAAKSNRIQDLQPLVNDILAAIGMVKNSVTWTIG